MNRSFFALALIACAACSPKPTSSARADATFAVGSTPTSDAGTFPTPASTSMATARATVDHALAGQANPIVDVAPARAPSAETPMGTVFVGAVVGGASRKALLAEWDVARARPIYSIELPAGESPLAVRVAVTADRVFAVVDEWKASQPVSLLAFDRQLQRVGARTLGPGTDISLDASGDWVVVAARGPEDVSPLTVTLLSSRSLEKRGEATLGATEMMTPTLRPRSVAIHGDRVIVGARRPVKKLEQASPTGAAVLPPLTLFALDIPSLRVAVTRETEASSHYPAFVTSRGGRLFAQYDSEVTELTRDLRVVGVRRAGFGAAAIGPDGALASTLCSDPDDTKERCAPDAGSDDANTCVAAWPHDKPLLVCGGDRVRIAPMR